MTTITNPAANAVRHGLAGTRHVLPEHRECVKTIEKDLIDTYKPECPDEHELLAEMAVHKFRVGEIDRQQLIRDGLLKEKADEIAESESKEKFETLFKKFQNEPQHHIDEFKFHHLGAKFAATTWQTLAESASPDGGGVTIEIAWQAVMTEGRSPHVLYTSGPGGWLMGRVLAASADPDEAIEIWLEKSGARHSKTAASRARTFMQLATNSEIAQKELHDRAQEKMQFWQEWAESRQNVFNLYKEKFAETIESGDDQLDRDARLTHRYRVKSLNQFNTLQRRLDNQRSAKMKHYRWTQDYLAREKQQKISNDFKAANMTQAQSERLIDWRTMEFSEMQAAANRERQREAESTKESIFEPGEIENRGYHQTSPGVYTDDPAPEMQSQAATYSNPSEPVALESKTLKVHQEKAAARERLENLDGGRWLKKLENIKEADLQINMFREWPEELVMVHSIAICAMITKQEGDEDRKAAAAAHWLAEIAYRVARDELAAAARANVSRPMDQFQSPEINRETRRRMKRNKKK